MSKAEPLPPVVPLSPIGGGTTPNHSRYVGLRSVPGISGDIGGGGGVCVVVGVGWVLVLAEGSA